MSGTEALILCGIIILSLSVLAMISPRFFRLALRLILNVLFGMLALSIIAEIWPIFPIGVNLWTMLICMFLGLPGLILLILWGIWR